MLKKSMFFAAIASMVMATSCSQEDLTATKLSSNEISVNPSMGLKTRAVETTISNLGCFTVNAFQDGADNYMDGVKYTSTDGSVWNTDAGKFYWPVEGNLHFYAYAPNEPGQTGTFKLDKDAQTFTDFTPNASAADQKDFVYAKATGDMATNGKTGIDLTFQHALSEITIAAKNTNTAYTVEVTGVKIGNVVTKGTFTFPSTTGTTASWSLSNETSDLDSYTTTWDAATTLGNDVSTLNAANVPFMIIPQQLETADKASEKAHIAVKVKITMQGGQVIHDGWSYVGIDTNWEMGKKYAYTLDYSNGAGQDEDGNKIVSGQEIKLNCAVTPWDESQEDIEFNKLVHIYNANSVIMKLGDLKTVYGIDITRANVFWSNTEVGDVANLIDSSTEWTAEVIWQDIDHHAINFCDANGKVIAGDKYNGMGKEPLYLKAATSTSGNVLIGVKKKGAGTDDYLWSWHLWLTEEPQEIAGFMDRNLGATSASPTDGSKTFGLYYQFGRKEPFTRSKDIYDVNGKSISPRYSSHSYNTFARAVKSPLAFFTEPASSPYDWASPNNYTDKNWNDITGTNGKSLFDPSPSGWKLADLAAFSNFSIRTFLTDEVNDGKIYKGNWFPSSGHISSANSYTRDKGYGGWWSETPYNSSYGYGVYYADNTHANYVTPDFSFRRTNAFPVRCVKEGVSN